MTKFLTWTSAEDKLLQNFYPDYRKILAALPHRTLNSIKHRCELLGIRSKKHVWTNREVALLRAHYSHSSKAELEALIGLSIGKIKSKAVILRIHRKTRLEPTGSDLVDELLARARYLGVNMVALDRQAKTGKYFQNLRYHIGISRSTRSWFRLARVIKGINALGGTLYADWRKDEDQSEM